MELDDGKGKVVACSVLPMFFRISWSPWVHQVGKVVLIAVVSSASLVVLVLLAQLLSKRRFDKHSERFDRHSQRLEKHSRRFDKVEGRLLEIDAQLLKIQAHLGESLHLK